MKLSRLLRFILSPFMFYVDDPDNESGVRQTDEEIKQQIEERNNARLKMYDQIADQNEEAHRDEFEEIPDDAHTRFQPEPESGEGDNPNAPSNQSAEPKHRIKVNGKEQELSYEELVARAQKVESADDYLEQAKRIRLDALQSRQAATPAAETPPVEDDLALVRALQMGSEEEALHAIRQLRSPTTDLPKLIDERMSFQQAVSRFQTEFKDVFDDPNLRQLVLNKDAELVSQGDARSYWERYESIGNEVREWVGGVRKTPTDKLSRKQSATGAPAAAGSRVSQQAQEEPDESVSDVIAQMARTRGQVR